MERIPFKTPDLHGLRKRTPSVNFLAYPDEDPYGFFAAAKEQYPSLAELSNRQITGVIKASLKHYADEVACNRRGVILPGGLGAVLVGISKPPEEAECKNIDFHSSARLGFIVHHRNHHTDGYLAKICYYNNVPRHRLNFHHQIGFKPCRKLSRAVSAVMKEEGGYNNYFSYSKGVPIAYLYRKPTFNKASKKHRKEEEEMRTSSADYDEFNFDD